MTGLAVLLRAYPESNRLIKLLTGWVSYGLKARTLIRVKQRTFLNLHLTVTQRTNLDRRLSDKVAPQECIPNFLPPNGETNLL